MNSTTRILVAALLCATAVACSKKVKEVPPAEPTPSEPAPVTEPAPTPGAYTPESLDTDACLRQRVVYFDLRPGRAAPGIPEHRLLPRQVPA